MSVCGRVREGDQITHLLSKSLLMYQICGRCPDHAPHKIGLEQSPQQPCCNNDIHKVSDLTLKRYAGIQRASGNKHEGIQTARCEMRRLPTPLGHGSLKVESSYTDRELETEYGKFVVVARMPGSVSCMMRPCVAYHEIWLETVHVRPIGERGHAALGRRRCRL